VGKRKYLNKRRCYNGIPILEEKKMLKKYQKFLGKVISKNSVLKMLVFAF
jgi:hypothetical protein